MTSLNKVTLIGRIGKEPLPHIFPDGKTIIGLSLATSDKWKDKETGEWKENTEWHTISVKNPVFVEYITNQVNKGDLIYLEGALQSRKWIKKDGSEGSIIEVVVRPFKDEVKLIKKNSEPEKVYTEPVAYNAKKAAMEKTKAEAQSDLDDDDVPF